MKKLVIVLCLFLGIAQLHANTQVDPTKPSVNNTITGVDAGKNSMLPEGLKLTAIINKDQHKLAIINGKSFLEGQQVQGYDVVVISQNHVILNGSEGKKTLYVNNNNVKKDANYGY